LSRDSLVGTMPTGPTDGGGVASEPTATDGFGFFFGVD
jgi:hypothetical protein